jgi:predicted NAD/FAD-binding protein
MDVGIIGAGASGLTAAWLLQEHHNVTVFEKQERLGGHAHTVDIAVGGKLIPVDAGFDFFTQKLWPTFYRLLKILNVGLYRYAGTTTLYTADNRRVYPMPAVRDGGVCWPLFKPHSLSKMIQFQRALQLAKPLIDAFDTSVTVEEFTENLGLGRSFRDEFCYPMLQSIWGIDRQDAKRFSAYNALKYFVLCEAGKFSQFYFTEVVGGSREYIDALVKSLNRVRVEAPVEIRRLTRTNGRYVVDLAGGRREFDTLILATNARDARELVAELDSSEALRDELSKFEYFKSTIAIHGDKRLMPASEKHWSVFNIRHDADHSALTIWKKWKSRTPVFKSWVAHESIVPDPLYFTASYDHPVVGPAYFEAQRRLEALQGRNNLWLAGLYTHDIDSHESAILSAVKIAQRLNPHSSNLNRLVTS